jgi:lipopolysaccharide export system ATP-binding protein
MKHILEIKQLVKSFGGVNALDHLSLFIPENQVVGIVGPNGSGKTTLINVLSGFLRPDHGEVFFRAEKRGKILPWNNHLYGITRTFQQIRLFGEISVLDNILVVLSSRNPFRAIFDFRQHLYMDKALNILKHVGLFEKRFNHANDLSYGQKKLLEIARVLAMDAEIVLLDEPFAGIDPIAVGDIQEIIRDLKTKGIGILITDHNVRETLGICDRAHILKDGRIEVQGSAMEIAESPVARKFYLGEGFRL